MLPVMPCTPDGRPARQPQGCSWSPGRALLWAGCALLLLLTTWLRSVDLDRLPGINGDEAWSGVQAVNVVQGKPVAWTTPTGNPINVFYLGPLAVLHAIFPPSFLLLRVVSLFSGMLSLVVNYLLCKRTLGKTTAVISTLILAVLPINIAYSRFGWDASQSLLFTLPVVYLPVLGLHRRAHAARYFVGAAACLAAAIVVHPTNVFIAPCLVVPYSADEVRWKSVLRYKSFLWFIGAALTMTVWAVAECRAPGSTVYFLQHLGALFSGRTIYQFITGSTSPATRGANEIILFTLEISMLLLLAVGLARILHLPDSTTAEPDYLLAGALLLSLLGFVIFAGPIALTPGYERYAIWLIAPVVILVSRALAAWLERDPRSTKLRAALLLCAGWLLAISFVQNYCLYLKQTGGRGHRTFRTAAVEPKRQSLDYIRLHVTSHLPQRIVAEEWWLYWPLKYLAANDAQIEVSQAAPRQSPGDPGYISSAGAFNVSFTAPTGRRNIAHDTNDLPGALQKCIADASGQPLIVVKRVGFESSQKD